MPGTLLLPPSMLFKSSELRGSASPRKRASSVLTGRRKTEPRAKMRNLAAAKGIVAMNDVCNLPEVFCDGVVPRLTSVFPLVFLYVFTVGVVSSIFLSTCFVAFDI